VRRLCGFTSTSCAVDQGKDSEPVRSRAGSSRFEMEFTDSAHIKQINAPAFLLVEVWLGHLVERVYLPNPLDFCHPGCPAILALVDCLLKLPDLFYGFLELGLKSGYLGLQFASFLSMFIRKLVKMRKERPSFS